MITPQHSDPAGPRTEPKTRRSLIRPPAAVLWLVVSLSLLPAPFAEAVPRRIIILRHGEKLDSYKLCDLGQRRSLALRDYYLGKGAAESQILLRQGLAGIGIALFNPANNSAIIGSLPKEKTGLASSFLALARNLGMVIGVAFAEMVMAFKSSSATLTAGAPPLDGIHAVWKIVMGIGLVAILISWTRERGSSPSSPA